MPAISPARRVAFRILLTVERGQAHSDDLLRGKTVSALSSVDRNLATTLVLGVLRWQLRLDRQLKSHLARPGAKLDAEVLIALRLGAFQLLHLDRIPAHAAISESVELARQAGHRFATGMVNAVLRKIAQAPREAESAAQAYPAWMVERWAARYGAQIADAICRHGQTQPALSVRLTEPQAEAELVQSGVELAPGELLTCARTILSGDVTATAAFREGRARIQDEGSQLIAELASTICNQDQKKILDACAAPGGKTLILAERNSRSQIVACEASPQRFTQLRERVAAYSARVECRLADATQLPEDAIFDGALVDAPCSGTGTLGRNPEIRHRLRLEDLARHADRQRNLLRAALRAVRAGGSVVYSTCSLEPEENEQVIAAVLGGSSDLRQLSLDSAIEALRKNGVLTASGADHLRTCFTPEGALRLLPGALSTDGFYIALVEKSAG